MENEYSFRLESAPRYRPQRDCVLDEEFRKELITKFPKLRKYSMRKLKDIIYAFGEKAQDTIIHNREGVRLPQQLGTIFIGKFKAKTRKKDYYTSKLLKTKVVFNNTHTDHFDCKLFYSYVNEKYKLRNLELYMFKPLQQFQRRIGREYPQRYMTYIDIDTAIPVAKQVKVNFAITIKEQKYQKSINKYNEFEL